MGGMMPMLFYVLFETTGWVRIPSCPGTPWLWYRHKVFVKHNLLMMYKLEFIVKSWSCLWAKDGQNYFMTLPTSFSVHLQFCAFLCVYDWWLLSTYFSDVTKHYYTLNIDKVLVLHTRHMNQKSMLYKYIIYIKINVLKNAIFHKEFNTSDF